MASHFQKAEPTQRALRRVCREHITKALIRLRQSRHPATVHTVRKEIKKLRATLRLIEHEINRTEQRRVEKALRRAARQLAASRDARIMYHAFEQLAGRSAATRFPQLRKLLEKYCLEESRRFRSDDSAVLAKRILSKTGRRLTRLTIKTTGWTAIAPGLKQTYRAGQQGREHARQEPTDEVLHEWRKQVKTLCYQMRLLCPIWTSTGRVLITKLGRLADFLGEDHDLAVLKQFAAEHGHFREVAALNRLIAARQKKLRAAAFKLGAIIYAPAPAALCERLGKSWTAWHSEKSK